MLSARPAEHCTVSPCPARHVPPDTDRLLTPGTPPAPLSTKTLRRNPAALELSTAPACGELSPPGTEKAARNVSFRAGLQLCATSHSGRLGPVGRAAQPGKGLERGSGSWQPRGAPVGTGDEGGKRPRNPAATGRGFRQRPLLPAALGDAQRGWCSRGGHQVGMVQPQGATRRASAAVGYTQWGQCSPGGQYSPGGHRANSFFSLLTFLPSPSLQEIPQAPAKARRSHIPTPCKQGPSHGRLDLGQRRRGNCQAHGRCGLGMGTEHLTCPNCAGTRKSAALGKTRTRHGLSHTCCHRLGLELVWEMRD